MNIIEILNVMTNKYDVSIIRILIIIVLIGVIQKCKYLGFLKVMKYEKTYLRWNWSIHCLIDFRTTG
jgi:hypothetical protein